ncbi:MAG: spore germination protein GerW family protein [Cyanobacteria bacterium J06554_6]
MITQNVVKQLAEDLKLFAKAETIFGEPIEVQGNTVIPVCKMSIGYGGGGGEGEGADPKKGNGKGTGAGAGGGVKIEPTALIVVQEGKVSVVGIQAKGSKLEALLEKVPETIEKLMMAKENKKEKTEDHGEES